MVSLSAVRSSNNRITTSLPANLVAVFVGATSGIGLFTLKQFAKHVRQPRVYIVGRSEESAKRIIAECTALNADGEYVFIGADVSLIRAVDDVCRDIALREQAINLLFLTPGTLVAHTETPEKLHLSLALVYYSRARFISNLLPLLQRAPSLRRVVTVFAGGKEGPIATTDFPGWEVPLLSARGHASSMITVSLETLAARAPGVSFVHAFPGAVKTNLGRGGEGGLPALALRAVFKVIGPLVYIPHAEVGQRQLFLATSARYPPREGGGAGGAGVPLEEAGVAVARGTGGESGGGVYSVDWDGESAGAKVERLLAMFRREGISEKVWIHTEEEFRRIVPVETKADVENEGATPDGPERLV